jgi:hypothetical protein
MELSRMVVVWHYSLASLHLIRTAGRISDVRGSEKSGCLGENLRARWLCTHSCCGFRPGFAGFLYGVVRPPRIELGLRVPETHRRFVTGEKH